MDLPRYDYLYQYIEHWSREDPEFQFIRFKWNKLTTKELEDKVNHLAEAMLDLGVKRGDCIVTILPMILEYILIYLAGNSIGAIIVPMDVRFRPADYRRFIPHINPKLVFLISEARGYHITEAIKELSKEFNPNIKYYMIGNDDFGTPYNELLQKEYELMEKVQERRDQLDPEDGALIIFTGGTTGIPKAALISHKNIARASYLESSYIQKRMERLGVEGRFPMLCNFPPSHVGGSIEMFATLIAGGNKIILQEQWNPYRVLRAIKKYKMPLIGGVPTMYAIMLTLNDLDEYDLSSLKIAIVSGEKLTLELLTGIQNRICSNILNAYGSTEFGPEVTFTELGDPIEELAKGYIGKLLPEQEMKIIDEKDREVPTGEIGEMLFRGSLTISEYYKMPEENQATFIEGGWCRSGDLGYITEDNRTYIKGRKKFIIRVGSYTVLPSEVESVVIKHPDVALAAAVGMPDKIYNEVVWVAIVPKEGKSVKEEEILSLCKEQLSDFKVPRKLIIMEELPITRLAKVDRPTLQKKLIEKLREA